VIEADLHARRVDRLRHELLDEGVALPADDAVTALLLEELDYARHPLAHEGVAPRFGAMLSARRPVLATVAGSTERIECADDDVDIVRRMADGRSSFMARSTSGTPELLWLDQLRMSADSIHVEGRAFNTNAVANFVENLDKVPEFDEPTLKSTEAQQGGIYKFVINFNYSFASHKPAAEGGTSGTPASAPTATSPKAPATPASAG
jgi:hypothetical protein